MGNPYEINNGSNGTKGSQAMYSQVLTVESDMDIVVTRMRVREMARRAGLSLTEQASISLAVSYLANALGMGPAKKGQVTINCLEDNDPKSVQIICMIEKVLKEEELNGIEEHARWLVDELNIESIPPWFVRVTATKHTA